MSNIPRFVFFGTPDIAVISLEALRASGMLPSCVITAPDARQGRGMLLTPSPAAQWADSNGIPTLKPEKLSDGEFVDQLASFGAEFFVVVAYGKIIPKKILELAKFGTLNMHPSLLPRHRGPSPIESQILTETDVSGVGVSVMLLDEQMDHGPVLSQESVGDELPEWPVAASRLRELLARRGAALLTKTIPLYLSGKTSPKPQDDTSATYCSMVRKEHAQLDLSDDPRQNYLKILAYDVWPRAYFFAEKNSKKIRVIVTSARLESGVLVLERVIPEGKKEMAYADFLR